MSKAKKNSIEVQGSAIAVVSNDTGDFISLTDMAKKFGDDVLIYNWMRNRNTLEFIGIWEQIHNPAFKGLEFETFRNQAGLNRFATKQWRDAHPGAEGNLRDHAPLEQLVVLTNLESLNSVLIRQRLPQPERLTTLNHIAITQMRTLLSASSVKRLK